ncbi:hypothetical protein F7R06_09755 [Pseudomonas moorei]|nr:hypothetical protein F7R06_09755 [Pseudomonas moorei]
MKAAERRASVARELAPAGLRSGPLATGNHPTQKNPTAPAHQDTDTSYATLAANGKHPAKVARQSPVGASLLAMEYQQHGCRLTRHREQARTQGYIGPLIGSPQSSPASADAAHKNTHIPPVY